MTHGSLFSGIGGFDLAAEWMGWENKFHCEWNPFGQKVLKHYWPNAESFNDITKTDFTPYANRIDILTGGFPCQPYSLAGKRKGKEDERHLWPEMLRAIKEIQPRWVVGENVFGLINWSKGLVFNEVQADLEAEGYEVFPYVLPAAAVNAPHRRDRVWFVAKRIITDTNCINRGRIESGIRKYPINKEKSIQGESVEKCNDAWDATNTSQQRCDNGGDNREERHFQATSEWELQKDKSERNGWQFGIGENGSVSSRADTNTNSNGQHRGNSEHEINTSEGRFDALRYIKQMGSRNDSDTSSQGLQTNKQFGINEKENRKWGERISRTTSKLHSRSNWEHFPTQSPICIRNDGFSTELDGITFSKWRNESIKAAGNAIVPNVAYQIFKSIEQFNRTGLR